MPKQRKSRKSTSTSAFGTKGRFGHDSSKFYNTRMYAGESPPEKVEHIENAVEVKNLDRVFCHTSEEMTELPDNSVHLMVTSPPYNASKEYDDDLPLKDYLGLLKRVFAETHRVLATGGRACVNIANLGRKPYIPLHAMIINDMLDIGYYMRGEIIWDKGSSAGGSCAWGSWRSASNPVLRDVHEYIMVFCKDSFSRPRKGKENTVGRDEFLESTKSVWTFNSVSAKSVGHPAPFPEELPSRLIDMYTFKGDVILDPFCGAGTTCLAAKKLGRRYVGYDISEEYVALAERRIADSAKNPK